MADFWYDPEVGEGGYEPLAKIVNDLAGIAAIVFLIIGVVAVIRLIVFLFKYFGLERKHLNTELRQEMDRALFTIVLCIVIPIGLTLLLWMWKK